MLVLRRGVISEKINEVLKSYSIYEHIPVNHVIELVYDDPDVAAKNTVYNHLSKLVKRGLLERVDIGIYRWNKESVESVNKPVDTEKPVVEKPQSKENELISGLQTITVKVMIFKSEQAESFLDDIRDMFGVVDAKCISVSEVDEDEIITLVKFKRNGH